VGIITIIVLDTIHHSVFYLKQNVSETRFSLFLQMKLIQVGLLRFKAKREEECRLRNVVF
jgi:hypothetical protein